MKIITEKSIVNEPEFERKSIAQLYINKYFNLFLNAYKWTGLEERQVEYIMRKFFFTGSICAFVPQDTKPIEGLENANVNAYPTGLLAFTTFAPLQYDINDWAIVVQLVPSRGATFIPRTPQIVDKDVVIGYCQRNHKPVCIVVDYYVSKIVEVEMTIRQQLLAHKVPWILATTPENETAVKRLFEKIKNDSEVLYLKADEIEALKTLQSGNAYIIDKLYQYKMQLENELLTYLGIDNVGGIEKKEHLMVDEVNANNQIIKDSSDSFLEPMKEFCSKIKKVLGHDVSVESSIELVIAYNESNNKENDYKKGDTQDE